MTTKVAEAKGLEAILDDWEVQEPIREAARKHCLEILEGDKEVYDHPESEGFTEYEIGLEIIGFKAGYEAALREGGNMLQEMGQAWYANTEAMELGRVIATKAKGFCLYPTISDDDIVFVDTERLPEDGNIVFVEIGGNSFLKVYREQEGKVWFEYQARDGFTTAKMEPDNYTIIGVAISVNKDLTQKFVKIPVYRLE